MNPTESPALSEPLDLNAVILERVAAMPLHELAAIGRPPVPVGKPEAVFVKCKKGMFTYHVRGKHFRDADRAEVAQLVKGKPRGDRKAEMKRLDRLLLRPLTVTAKVVAENAIKRIREQIAFSAEAARIAKLSQEIGAPYREEDAGIYLLTKPSPWADEPNKPGEPTRTEVVWDPRGFCAIKIDEARILPCYLIEAGSVWERVVIAPDAEIKELLTNEA